MLREATPADAAAMEAFLARHAASSMFLRGNLDRQGTQERVHSHGTTFCIAEVGSAVTAVLGWTNGGFLMCQAPEQEADFWQAAASALGGREVAGITGVPEQVDAWLGALGLTGDIFALNRVEPLYHLSLGDVAEVPPSYALQRPDPSQAEVLATWFEGYYRDSGLPGVEGQRLIEVVQRFVDNPDGRVMIVKGAPVAMTSLNARTVDTVQVGGVFVPPEQRGNGYGGDVVALHLAELAQEGMRHSVLFAASSYAAQAYERIGFQQVGEYQIVVLNTPVVVGAAAAEMSIWAKRRGA